MKALKAIIPAAQSRNKDSVIARRKVFVERYLSNGRNGTEAAREAGFGGKPAALAVRASELLARDDVKAMIDARTRKAMEAAELTTDNWAKEVAALAFFRPGDLYDEDGNLIPVHKLPSNIQAAIAAVDPLGGSILGGKATKIWDKTAALGLAARHLGLFEKDNAQRAENVRVLVQLVG